MRDYLFQLLSPLHSAARSRYVASVFTLLALASLAQLGTALAQAQTPAAPPDPSPTASTQPPGATQSASPDAKIVEGPAPKPKTPAQLTDQAWSMLSTAVADDKHPELRIQALAALGLLGSNAHSLALIRTAMQDKDVDVRVSAALAAGQTRSANLTTDLRRMMDDKEPGVTYVAALTLWKMHDRSGEDILTAVADGDRTTSSTFMNGTEHKMNKQLHDPAGMARFGAMQGAYMLLGPFGYGLSAYEYLHKNGGDGARVAAIEAIAQNHTAHIRAELIGALADKDIGVRAAAAKGLARYHDADVPPALAILFDDAKLPVRLTAAAAYLVSAGGVAGSPLEGEVAHPAKR